MGSRRTAGLVFGAWMVFVLLVAVFGVVLNVPLVWGTGTIYIKADGSIDPPDAPIQTFDSITYTLTDNITSTTDGIVVERDNIILDGAGYTLQGSGDYAYSGILGYGSNVTIKSIQIKEFYYGVYFYISSYNTVSGNNITNGSSGIYLHYSSYNTVSGNNITNNLGEGIYVYISEHNSISGNNIAANYWKGIHFLTSSNNTMSGNNITNSVHGIYSSGGVEYNTISGNNITNNGVGILSGYNDVMSGNNITNNSNGIEVNGDNNTIFGNTITNNSGGIIFKSGSSNNSISRNNVTDNSNTGIGGMSCFNNSMSGNHIANSSYGFYFDGFNNNSIGGNNITNSSYVGIYVYGSNNNRFYHNNFVNNAAQVYSYDSINVWDDGYPSGGNYWSDYTGVDEKSGLNQDQPGSDGIGDTSYVIDADNQDRYPFMNPWTDTNPPETTISLSGVLGDNDWFTSDVTVTLSATDDTEVEKTEYSFDNAAWNIYTAPFVLTNEGTTTVYYKSTDKAGNPETTKTRTIKIDKTEPSANAGVDQTVNEDTLATFDGSASTDQNGIAAYTWTFTDTTPQTLSGENPTYTFATPGTYTITLEVADPAGHTATDTVTINVLDTTTPVANAGQDQTVNVDATVSFDAGASSDNVGIVSYEWDFGDQTTGTGKTTTHTYTSQGTYTATLTVKDSAGNSATDTITVTVLPEEAPPPPPTEPFPIWIVGIAIAAIVIVLAAILLLRKRK